MAEETVLVCDFAGCRKSAVNYRFWRGGERQAFALDLCDDHATPLLTFMEMATLKDLPVKPRQRMEVTLLQTTPKTAPLKKKP